MRSVPRAVATGSHLLHGRHCEDVTRSLPLPVLTSSPVGEISMHGTTNTSLQRGDRKSTVPRPRILLTAHRSLLTLLFLLPTAHRSLLTLFFLLLTAHCSLLTVSAAAWTRQPTGTMAWLRGVYFLDQNRG